MILIIAQALFLLAVGFWAATQDFAPTSSALAACAVAAWVGIPAAALFRIYSVQMVYLTIMAIVTGTTLSSAGRFIGGGRAYLSTAAETLEAARSAVPQWWSITAPLEGAASSATPIADAWRLVSEAPMPFNINFTSDADFNFSTPAPNKLNGASASDPCAGIDTTKQCCATYTFAEFFNKTYGGKKGYSGVFSSKVAPVFYWRWLFRLFERGWLPWHWMLRIGAGFELVAAAVLFVTQWVLTGVLLYWLGTLIPDVTRVSVEVWRRKSFGGWAKIIASEEIRISVLNQYAILTFVPILTYLWQVVAFVAKMTGGFFLQHVIPDGWDVCTTASAPPLVIAANLQKAFVASCSPRRAKAIGSSARAHHGPLDKALARFQQALESRSSSHADPDAMKFNASGIFASLKSAAASVASWLPLWRTPSVKIDDLDYVLFDLPVDVAECFKGDVHATFSVALSVADIERFNAASTPADYAIRFFLAANLSGIETQFSQESGALSIANLVALNIFPASPARSLWKQQSQQQSQQQSSKKRDPSPQACARSGRDPQPRSSNSHQSQRSDTSPARKPQQQQATPVAAAANATRTAPANNVTSGRSRRNRKQKSDDNGTDSEVSGANTDITLHGSIIKGPADSCWLKVCVVMLHFVANAFCHLLTGKNASAADIGMRKFLSATFCCSGEGVKLIIELLGLHDQAGKRGSAARCFHALADKLTIAGKALTKRITVIIDHLPLACEPIAAIRVFDKFFESGKFGPGGHAAPSSARRDKSTSAITWLNHGDGESTASFLSASRIYYVVKRLPTILTGAGNADDSETFSTSSSCARCGKTQEGHAKCKKPSSVTCPGCDGMFYNMCGVGNDGYLYGPGNLWYCGRSDKCQPPKLDRRQPQPAAASTPTAPSSTSRATSVTDIETDDAPLGAAAAAAADIGMFPQHHQILDEMRIGNTAAFRVVVGDLFTSTSSIGNCVSRDLALGQGIATTFRQFGHVGELRKKKLQIGDVAALPISDRDPRLAYYLVTKDKANEKPTLANLGASLDALTADMAERGIKYIALPKIGCGLDKLNIAHVLPLVAEKFGARDISVTMCVGRNDKDTLPAFKRLADTRARSDVKHPAPAASASTVPMMQRGFGAVEVVKNPIASEGTPERPTGRHEWVSDVTALSGDLLQHVTLISKETLESFYKGIPHGYHSPPIPPAEASESAVHAWAMCKLELSTRLLHLAMLTKFKAYTASIVERAAKTELVPMLIEFVQHLALNGKNKKGTTGLLPQTTMRHMASMTAAMEQLYLYTTAANSLPDVSAMKLCKSLQWSASMDAMKTRAMQSTPEDLDTTSIDDMIEAVRNVPEDQRSKGIHVQLILMMCTAMRWGDAAKTLRSNISFNSQTHELQVLVADGKGVKMRNGKYRVHTRVMVPQFRAMLEEYLDKTARDKFLFPRPEGRSDTRNRMANAALQTVRKTLSTQAIRRGSLQAMARGQMGDPVDPETLMLFSGHKSIHTLMRYLNWGKEAEALHQKTRKAAENLAAGGQQRRPANQQRA